MRRLIAIFFLVVFLFNVGGYYLVFWAMEKQSRLSLLSRLDANNYGDEELVVLTVPLSLPYPIYTGDYERVDGEFVHNGQFYKLVKQKMENDTLFIVCIKDRDATRLANAVSDYSKVANAVPVNSKQAVKYLGKLHKDFNAIEFKIFYQSRSLYDRTFYAINNNDLPQTLCPVEVPPPEKTS